MTLKEKIDTMRRLQAYLECLRRRSSGIGEICNDCDDCYFNYAQGTIGEQKEDIERAIFALCSYEAAPKGDGDGEHD